MKKSFQILQNEFKKQTGGETLENDCMHEIYNQNNLAIVTYLEDGHTPHFFNFIDTEKEVLLETVEI